ncbi:hypothetical protein RND81_14G172900 [Saponaria officinalis]|uniref:KIB1-4 beta-propeller domain-containing protein n=1 Tax=Saponaria officinalis TaxID=3572 RepID=A0AAW1GUZ5_SAPOF
MMENPQKSSTNQHLKVTNKVTKYRSPSSNYRRRFHHPTFTDHRHFDIQTTTIHCITLFKYYFCNCSPWIVAAVNAAAAADKPQLLHPLTLKPYHYDLPKNFNFLKFKCYKRTENLIHCTEFNFDKLVIPLPRSKIMSNNTLWALYNGGELIGRPFLIKDEQSTPWVKLSEDKFDDIIVFGDKDDKIYALDRLGMLHVIGNNVTSRVLRFNLVSGNQSIVPGLGRVGWRKRLLEKGFPSELYVVVRVEEKVFRVYTLNRQCRPYCWNEVKGFGDGVVLFVSRDSWFFRSSNNVGKKYENCIVFSEAGFPKYGDDGSWEYKSNKCEEEIWVFRMSDGYFGKVGESVDFPEIDWSPPSWVFDVESCLKYHPRPGSNFFGKSLFFPSSSPRCTQSEREPDKDDGGVQSDLNDSNNKDEEEQEGVEFDSNVVDQEQEDRSDSDIEDRDDGKMQCDSNNQETDDEEMQSNVNIEGDTTLKADVPASLFASVSSLEEEVTRTLLRMDGGNEAIQKESSRKNITLSAPRACTSSSTTKVNQSDTATTEFEGFNIRALESLATMVEILKNNTVQSLSDCQADYLSSTLSDLKIMSFKVHWLGSFVEKAVKLHKSKPFVDSLNKLSDLSSQVKERRAILLDEVAKLTDEENKLKNEMANVSKMVPFAGHVKLDEPLGLGIT